MPFRSTQELREQLQKPIGAKPQQPSRAGGLYADERTTDAAAPSTANHDLTGPPTTADNAPTCPGSRHGWRDANPQCRRGAAERRLVVRAPVAVAGHPVGAFGFPVRHSTACRTHGSACSGTVLNASNPRS